VTNSAPVNPIPVIAAAFERGDVAAQYDHEIDEMELVLPGSIGREARAVLVAGELYVRLDVETGQPLSIVIPGFTSWMERQQAVRRASPPSPAPPKAPATFVAKLPGWSETATSTAYQAVYQTVRYSNDLYAGAARS
jgi:hypothetical protein